MQRFARIFVHRHNLFQDANSFPRAKLEENCVLQGTGNVQGQTYKHVFEQNRDNVLIFLQIFCNALEKLFTNSSLFAALACLSVLWYKFIKKQIFPLFCNNHKTTYCSDLRFENWGISVK